MSAFSLQDNRARAAGFPLLAVLIAVILITSGDAGAVQAGSANCDLTFTSPLFVSSPAPLGQAVFDPACQYVYMTSYSDSSVRVFNLTTKAFEPDPIAVGSIPTGIDITPDGSTLYVTSQGAHAVSVVDTVTRQELRKIPIPSGGFNYSPTWIAIAGNGKALVTQNYAGSGWPPLYEINLATDAVTQRMDFWFGGVSTESTVFAASADNSRIAIAAGNISSGPVFTYSAATDTFTPPTNLNAYLQGVGISGDGNRVLTTTGQGVVYVLDGNAAPIGPISTVDNAWSLTANPTGTLGYRLVSGGIERLDLQTLKVKDGIGLPGTQNNRLGISDDGSLLAATSTTGIWIVKPDAAAGEIPTPAPVQPCSAAYTLPRHLPTNGLLKNVAIDNACHYAYLSNNTNNRVEVVNLQTGQLEAPIPVGSSPVGLDLSPDNTILYVANTGGSNVSVVDVATKTELRRIPIPPDLLGTTQPLYVAVGDTGAVLVSTQYPGSGYGPIRRIDPSTDFVQAVGVVNSPAHIKASGDRHKVFVVEGNISSGPVSVYTPATDTWGPTKNLNSFVWRGAPDWTGTRFLVAPGTFVYDSALTLMGTIPGSGQSIALAPSGKVGYRAGSAGIEVLDADHFLVTGSLPTGDPPAGELAVSADGKLIVAITQHGLSIVQPLKAGDSDCSGGIDSVDALRVLRASAGLPNQLPAGCELQGDVNCSGSANAVDALLILRFVAGLPVNLPLGCTPLGTIPG